MAFSLTPETVMKLIIGVVGILIIIAILLAVRQVAV